MTSNYPPGVTGLEYMISGPTDEWVEDRTCQACDGEITEHLCWYHPDSGAWAGCQTCGTETEIDYIRIREYEEDK